MLLASTLFSLYPFLRKLFVDGGYQGSECEQAVARVMAAINVEIVKCSDAVQVFVVLPRRWVVERTFAWLNRCSQLAKDFENRTRTALTFLKLASIQLITRNSAFNGELCGRTLRVGTRMVNCRSTKSKVPRRPAGRFGAGRPKLADRGRANSCQGGKRPF